jgi:hypothetical protein
MPAMSLMRGLFLIITGSLLGANIATAQEKPKAFVLLTLKDHKPVPNQRVRILMGATEDQIRQNPIQINLVTDQAGRTLLTPAPKMRWFQAWVDGPGPCPHNSYRDLISHIGVLFDEGIVLSNTCGSNIERLQPYETSIPEVIPKKSP